MKLKDSISIMDLDVSRNAILANNYHNASIATADDDIIV